MSGAVLRRRRADRPTRRRCARRFGTGRGGRDLVLLGDAAAAADRRNGMYAVYAFCREVDDIADERRGRAGAQAARHWPAWREEIDALYAGRPRHLVARALARAGGSAIELRREDFLAVIDGMEMDARGRHPRPRSGDARPLLRRGSRARSAISRCMSSAMPATPRMRSPNSLGRALQLTNILRDLDEDARRGRLYLPREILDRHGIRSARAGDGAAPSGVAGGLPRRSRRSPRRISRRPSGRWRDARAARCGRPR